MSVARQWQIAAVVDIETEGYNYKYIWNGQNYIYYFGCPFFFFFCILSICGRLFYVVLYIKCIVCMSNCNFDFWEWSYFYKYVWKILTLAMKESAILQLQLHLWKFFCKKNNVLFWIVLYYIVICNFLPSSFRKFYSIF